MAQEQVCTDHPFTALPQPLLELILIPSTSRKDKRSLRQTCKSFQQVLDESVTCIRLLACAREKHKYLKKMMMRLQHAHALKTIKYLGDVELLPQNLPKQVTTFEAYDTKFNVKELRSLPCLTSLYLYHGHGSREYPETDLGDIHGLTRLHIGWRTSSVAHLAPTLKHLSVRHCTAVPDIDKLTNLEVLDVRGKMPRDFFQTHSNLPLRHLRIGICYNNPLSRFSWAAAPTTLQRLTLDGQQGYTLPSDLPSSITHLQLGYEEYTYHWPSLDVMLEQAATALPGPKALDLFVYLDFPFCKDCFAAISKLVNLQSFGVCNGYSPKIIGRVADNLSKVLAVVQAAERGVRVSALSWEEFWGAAEDPVIPRTTWVTLGNGSDGDQ